MNFQSTEELLQAARDLIARLEREGHDSAAAELRDGFACLNGLTDGWAMFLESIERVKRSGSKHLDREERRALDAIREDVREIVHRA